MHLKVEANLRYFLPEAADVLLAIEAAPMEEQRLLSDRLTVNALAPLKTHLVAMESAVGHGSDRKASSARTMRVLS